VFLPFQTEHLVATVHHVEDILWIIWKRKSFFSGPSTVYSLISSSWEAANCPPQISLDQAPGSHPGRRGGKPATNRLSYGAAVTQFSYMKPIIHAMEAEKIHLYNAWERFSQTSGYSEIGGNSKRRAINTKISKLMWCTHFRVCYAALLSVVTGFLNSTERAEFTKVGAPG
jgi:hypothetical protein